MLGVKLLLLDQAELAAEDQKRHDSVIATLHVDTLSKTGGENSFFLRFKLDTLQPQPVLLGQLTA